VELLLAVSITTIIIVALYSVFNHTQKALRASMGQVDVLEAGRAAMSLIVGELEQMSACYESNIVNLYVRPNPAAGLFEQPLPGDNIYRTNLLDDFVFLSKQTNIWVASTYSVAFPRGGNQNNLVGTLMRYSVATNSPQLAISNTLQYADPPWTNFFFTNVFQPVIDGVIHLSLVPYDFQGQQLPPFDNNGVLKFRRTRLSYMPPRLNSPGLGFLPRATENRYYFISNGLPAFLELELGILEPTTYQQYRSIPSYTAATNFLAKHAGQVHVFRQRIPIRTAPQ
jgi:hypothetical protein